jgi:50S ribosomal protein L16 3-hydroxylase
MVDSLLGGHSPARFLARFWQKEALLVRAAVPGFRGLLDARGIFELASRDDVESRLVIREGRTWGLEHGPFSRRRLAALPARNWTVLVQGVNLHVDAADALLRRFAFVPYARLDDLMVSYAVPGGGVGPHFDSYDVFLLQGEGRRRWRIGAQRDLALVPRLPLRILRRFAAEQEWVLGPGDMLYLPPRYAHDGVALDACTTWSIGFRAPQAQELAVALLQFMQDEIRLEGLYADPDLAPAREPARLDRRMVARAARLLDGLGWEAAPIAKFLGCYLTEPKPHVVFDPRTAPLTRARFARALGTRGVALDRRTLMLYDERWLYVNGEAIPWPRSGRVPLRRLANARAVRVESPSGTLVDLLMEWCRHGFLHPAR